MSTSMVTLKGGESNSKEGAATECRPYERASFRAA